MKKSTKQALLIGGIVAGAVVAGVAIYKVAPAAASRKKKAVGHSVDHIMRELTSQENQARMKSALDTASTLQTLLSEGAV